MNLQVLPVNFTKLHPFYQVGIFNRYQRQSGLFQNDVKVENLETMMNIKINRVSGKKKVIK